jgi:outer membrane autotransporter protein
MGKKMKSLKHSSIAQHRVILLVGTALASSTPSNPSFAYDNKKWCAPIAGVAANWNAAANFCPGGPGSYDVRFEGTTYNPNAYIDKPTRTTFLEFLDPRYALEIRAGGELIVSRTISHLPTSELAPTKITNAGSFKVNDQLIGSIYIINQGAFRFGGGSADATTIDNTGTMNIDSTGNLGTAKLNNKAAGAVSFTQKSSAGAATIVNQGTIEFFQQTNAGSATFANSGSIIFRAPNSVGDIPANANSAKITNDATGKLDFYGPTLAGSAVIVNNNEVTFHDTASAASATITNNKNLAFRDTASAGTATIANNGSIILTDQASLSSASLDNKGTLTLNNFAAMHLANITNTGDVILADFSTLGNARVSNSKNISFSNSSGSANSTIDNASAGVVRFKDNSSAARTELNNAGKVFFSDFASGANASVTNAASGNLDISGLIAGGTPLGSLAGGGTVSLGSRSLTVGGNNADTTFSGVIQDGGVNGGVGGLVVKEGTGKLSLTGIQTFTGATNVNAGNLNVNGSIASSSAVNVNKGGTLSGSGDFGNVNVNGGTVSPGNSIGTMHIRGNLNMSAGSTYYVELNGQTSDLITVTGTANIQSSIFEIAHDTDTSSAPVLPGKTYTLLTTGRGLTVTTPDVAIADFPFVAFTLSTDAFNGYLTTSRSSERFADLASTPNQKAVANALDAATASNPVWQQVVGASEAQARAAFVSLSNASIHANAAGVLSEQSQYLRDAVTGRLRQDFADGTAMAPAGSVLSYAAEAPRNAYAAAGIPFYKAPPPAAAPTPAQVYAVWAQALGSQGSLKGDGNAAQTDHSLGGVISGIDVTFDGRWRVGLAGGYSQSSFSSTSIAASGSSESYHVALYGGGQVGAWGLRGGASFSWNDITTTRQIAVVNIAETQRGDDALKTTQVFGEVGHTFGLKAGALEPFANIAYVRVDGGVNETGMAAMTGSAKIDTTYTTLGLRGATALTAALTARSTLGWRHALGDITPEAILAFQPGGAAFTLAGTPIARDALVAEAGLDLVVAANASLGVSWSGQFADQSHSNAVKGNFSWRF